MRLFNRFWQRRGQRYDGDQLSAIRAEKGVGRPPRHSTPETVAGWSWVFQANCTNAMARGARVFGGDRPQYRHVGEGGLRHRFLWRHA